MTAAIDSGGALQPAAIRRAIGIVIAILIAVLGVASAHHLDSSAPSAAVVESLALEGVTHDASPSSAGEMTGAISLIAVGCVALALGCVLGMLWVARKWIARRTIALSQLTSECPTELGVQAARPRTPSLTLLSISRI